MSKLVTVPATLTLEQEQRLRDIAGEISADQIAVGFFNAPDVSDGKSGTLRMYEAWVKELSRETTHPITGENMGKEFTK